MAQQSLAATVLREKGPLSSTELREALRGKGKTLSPAAARQAIRRAHTRSEILSTAPVRFDRSYLYFLKSHVGKRYAKAVRQLLPSKPGFHRVYKTILANKGWITLAQIGKASGCLPPGETSRTGGRVSLDETVSQLLSLGLIDEVAGELGVFRIGSQFGVNDISRAAFCREIALETELLLGFRDWIRNAYLIAYDSNSILADNESPVAFNQSLWDLHGPIYFGPFSNSDALRRGKSGRTFLAAEITAYRQFNINDAESTVQRVNSIGHRWRSVSFCPVVLAPFYSKPAWTLLRSSGILALTIRDVFGRNTEELIRRFSDAITVQQGTSECLDDIERSLKLAEGTVAPDGLVGNLKGTLFELLVALGYQAAGFDTTLQKRIRKPDADEEFEVDIVARRGESLCKIIECKGRRRGYQESIDDVRRHFLNRCRAASDPYGWYVTDRYETVEAIYITSGDFSDKAREYAANTKASHGISCSTMDRNALLHFLNSEGQKRLVDIIERYYCDD
ncbi:MAG: hypothetical protein ACYTGL_20230 [Planctomycetota bacterium]|jgi:hypothetical protein